MDRERHNVMASLLAVIAAICLLHTCPGLAEFRAAIAVRNVTPDPLLPVAEDPVRGGIGRL
jgi:hypothetical protein